MIIGIDGNEANVQKRLGVGEYAWQLLNEFSRHQGIEDRQQFRIYLKQKPLPHMPAESKNWKYVVCGPSKAWTQVALPLNLFTKSPRPDVFFTPTHYAPRWSPIPTVVLILDVAYKLYPELFLKKDLYKLEKWTRYSVDNASAVLTISNSAKNDIIKYYNISEEKVHIIYPGIKSEIRNSLQNAGQAKFETNLKNKMQSSKQIQEKYNIASKYILFVGTLQPRKNIERLIEAYSRIVTKSNAKDANVQLVIIGKKGWQYESILAAPEKFGVQNSVKFLDFVGDEDLPTFYENAEFFVLPSLYEGFGLPVLEAMKYGCPVLTSNISSMPEAGGDAALYCDPTDVADIAKQMEKVLTDTALRSRLSKKGLEQIKKFSWEKAAKETLEVLQEVGKQ